MILELPRKDTWNPGGSLNPGFPDKPSEDKAGEPPAFCSVCSKTAMGKQKLD